MPKPFSCLSNGPRQRFRGPKPVHLARRPGQRFRGPKPFSCLSNGPRQRFRGPKPVNVARFIPLTGKDQLDSLRGTREAPGMQERTIWTAWEVAGRQKRINWTGRHQGGRKGSIAQSARHQGGTREAGKNHLDSSRGPFGASGLTEWRSLPATQLALCCLPGCPNGCLEFAGVSKWLSRASRAVHMAL